MAEWEALEERRVVGIRHARFNAALITAVILNANRGADSKILSPFDFLAGFEQTDEEREQDETRKSLKRSIALAFISRTATPKQVQAEKLAMIERMKDAGVEDPEGLIREVYPDL